MENTLKPIAEMTEEEFNAACLKAASDQRTAWNVPAMKFNRTVWHSPEMTACRQQLADAQENLTMYGWGMMALNNAEEHLHEAMRLIGAMKAMKENK